AVRHEHVFGHSSDRPPGIYRRRVLWRGGCVFADELAASRSRREVSDDEGNSGVSVTIYHNPACGTSRNTLAMIRHSGEEPEIIEYLKNPPGRARLIEP